MLTFSNWLAGACPYDVIIMTAYCMLFRNSFVDEKSIVSRDFMSKNYFLLNNTWEHLYQHSKGTIYFLVARYTKEEFQLGWKTLRGC